MPTSNWSCQAALSVGSSSNASSCSSVWASAAQLPTLACAPASAAAAPACCCLCATSLTTKCRGRIRICSVCTPSSEKFRSRPARASCLSAAVLVSLASCWAALITLSLSSSCLVTMAKVSFSRDKACCALASARSSSFFPRARAGSAGTAWTPVSTRSGASHCVLAALVRAALASVSQSTVAGTACTDPTATAGLHWVAMDTVEGAGQEGTSTVD
mmetsp:Transcript_77507/g.177498  ORF Transcript_77507/g.177498 Transcript_77507/m.177498 type:complete len:216 (-) Transcript_77507:896-1543(-)